MPRTLRVLAMTCRGAAGIRASEFGLQKILVYLVIARSEATKQSWKYISNEDCHASRGSARNDSIRSAAVATSRSLQPTAYSKLQKTNKSEIAAHPSGARNDVPRGGRDSGFGIRASENTGLSGHCEERSDEAIKLLRSGIRASGFGYRHPDSGKD